MSHRYCDIYLYRITTITDCISVTHTNCTCTIHMLYIVHFAINLGELRVTSKPSLCGLIQHCTLPRPSLQGSFAHMLHV